MAKSVPKKIVPNSRMFPGRSSDTEELEEKIKNKKLPEHVREEIDKEMKRLGG